MVPPISNDLFQVPCSMTISVKFCQSCRLVACLNLHFTFVHFVLDDEDVHQCGRCKDVFRNLQLYMHHKASKICKNPNKVQAPAAKKPETQNVAQNFANHDSQQVQTIKPANILEEAAKDTIYKQLEILVVDEEPEERHSTIDVQSISNDHQSNAVTYVAVQDKGDQNKISTPPVTLVNKDVASSKKGTSCIAPNPLIRNTWWEP